MKTSYTTLCKKCMLELYIKTIYKFYVGTLCKNCI